MIRVFMLSIVSILVMGCGQSEEARQDARAQEVRHKLWNPVQQCLEYNCADKKEGGQGK